MHTISWTNGWNFTKLAGTSLGHGEEVVGFWWPWPHFQCRYIIKTVKIALRALISWINRWNLTNLAQILHWAPRKYWLITQEAVALSQHDWKIADWDIKPQHKQTNKLHWDRGKKWLDFSDLDLIFKVTLALCGGYLISIANWHFFH